MLSLTIDDFAGLFGTDAKKLSQNLLDKIGSCNWNYSIIQGPEKDELVSMLLKRIDDRNFSVVANNDNSRWVKGWGENLEALVKSDGDLGSLVPRYYREGAPLRLRGEFIRGEDLRFEINFWDVYRQWIFEAYLENFQTIFELGSGSGFNVAALAQLYPQSTILGLDWAAPAVEIIETLRKMKGWDVCGHKFDFFHPDEKLDVPKGSAFYSFGAFEQLGTGWQPMLDFILRKKPALVLHIEPIHEWYEPKNSLLDDISARASSARNYLQGYAPAIAELEKQGRARILNARRLYFGSTWHEGWSRLFWQPL